MTKRGEAAKSPVWWAAIGNVVSILIALFAWSEAREANSISQKAFDRSTGRVLPYFHVECDVPHVLVKEPDQYQPPTVNVTITNDGDERISALKCQVNTQIKWSGDRGSESSRRPTIHSIELADILMPGESLTLNILPELILHLKENPPPVGVNSFWSACHVSFSAQIVGESHFSSSTSGGNEADTNFCDFGLTWEAAGEVEKEPLNFGVDMDRVRESASRSRRSP